MKYSVIIEETLTKELTIEANSEEEAYNKAHSLYTDEKIVLDESDHNSTNIYVLGETNEHL